MREILFRGKAIDCNEWVYGFPLFTDDRAFIHPVRDGLDFDDIDFGYGFVQVIPNSVNQDTGLNDRAGDKIFEGDVVKCYKYNGDIESTQMVEYYGGGFAPFAFPCWEEDKRPERSEVIGNIFDNPELAKV